MDMTSQGDEVYGYPLSYAQRRLWFMDQLFPGTPLYNLPLVLHLALPVDVPVLERALQEMARRHESLRTTFRMVDGEPVQVVSTDTSMRVRVVPLDHLPAAGREAAAMAFASAEVQQPFDLATGPLWRATLVRLDRADHLLLLTAHHIVSDGWSMGLMLRELQTLYAAFSSGGPSPLPDLPLQYVDYAIWQHEHLSSALVDRHLAYWRDTLADLPALDLPSDRARPATASLRGRRHHFEVPEGLRRAIDDLAQEEGATAFMALLAAYAVLLQRYTGDDDIPIGSPIAGRSRAEFEPLVGFFVNTLVMRVDLEGDPTFRVLLRRVRERALEAYTWQDLPFEKLVEDLQPVRDLSRNPLFQVMFALQNAPTAGTDAGAAVLRSVEIDSGYTNFDLALDVWRRGDGYAARIEYNVDLFDIATIDRMSRHWLTLLEGLAADPGRPVSSYAMEQPRYDGPVPVRADVGSEPVATPAETLGSLIRACALRQPQSPAIRMGESTLAYGELHRLANDLAVRLQALGVGPDRPVAVFVDRSPALVVAMLAIWYAGGAYVPVDPRTPDVRVRQLFDDIQPGVILTTRALCARCGPDAEASPREWESAVVLLDEDARHDARSASTPVVDLAGPTHLAYVVYTSGSTGQPRGVAVEHRALTNHLRWMQTIFPLSPGDRTLQSTSMEFDVSLWELAAPLVAGATLVLAPSGTEGEPGTMSALIADERICALQTTPSFLRMMLDTPALDRCTALRAVFCGAESMPRELAHRFASRGLPAVLYNMYGPTETAIDAAFFVCPASGDVPETRSGSVPIGRPIPGVRLSILDRSGHPVPDGLPGELHVAGANLARGYWRQPELTAERFVTDATATPGVRMYRTGDRVRRLPSGDIELLGRMDRQVKVRGVRIEPAEVERALLTHPLVRDAHVVPEHDARGQSRLVGYVAVPDGTLGPRDLRAHLADRLTPPMIPAAFVVVPALPRTPRGKVDRHALARARAAATPDDVDIVAPRTATEAAVLDIWQAVLGVSRASVDDNFFDLGGHSLMATQVISRVLERLQAMVPLRAFFEQPTVEALASRVDRLRAEREHPGEQPATRSQATPAAEVVDRLSDHEVEQLLRTLVARDEVR